MKPIFGFDKKTKTRNSDQFIVKTLPENIDFNVEEMPKQEDPEKIKTFKKLRIILTIILIPLVCVVTYAGIKEIYWLAITFGIVVLPLIAIFLYYTSSIDKYEKEKGFIEIENYEETMNNRFKKALDVPEEAHDIEVLSFAYINKGDQIVFKTKMFGAFNEQMKIYFKDNNYDTLYLSDLCEVYAFKVSNFKSIEKVDKQLKLFCWNRDALTKDFAKENYIKEGRGKKFLTSFMSVKYDNGTEELDLLLPWYEYPTICEFTGLSYIEK